jgi:hypothetical protein
MQKRHLKKAISYLLGFAAFPYLLVLTVVFALYASFAGGNALFANKLTRMNKQGAVDVSVTYLEPQEGEMANTSFLLKINAHSVDLFRYNFENISFLQFDDNEPIPYGIFDFTGALHHFKGILTFEQKLPADVEYLRLFIRNLDGVRERAFEWDLGEKPTA